MRLTVSLEWLASVDCGSFQNCLSATIGAKEMNQPALGSWLLDCKGREMLASVFLPSPFIFATDLVAMDRGTWVAAATVFHPCPQPGLIAIPTP